MSTSRAGITIAVIVCSQFLNAFTGSALNVSIPTIGADFAAAAADLGWLVTTYNMCTVALLLPLGRLADLTNRRAMFITGLAVLAVVAEVSAWVPTLGGLIATRVVQGVGASCLFATGQAILVSAVDPKQRGRAIGLTVAAVYVGLSVGPVIGGLITHHLGWRSVFHLIAVLGLVNGAFAVWRLPQSEQRRPANLLAELDVPGIALVVGAALALTYGLTTLPSPPGIAFTAAGVALLGVFVWVERRAAQPLISPALWAGGPNFALSNLSALLSYAATFAVSYLLAIHLQQVQGLTADLAGFVLITSPAVQALLSPWAGRAADRHSPFIMASAGMGLCAVGLIVFATISAQTPLVLIIANLALIGAGFGLFASPNTTAVMSMARPSEYGIANAFLSMMRNLGMVVSMAIITITVTQFFGRTAIADASPELITATLRFCFAVFAGICILGVFTSLRRSGATSIPEPK
ncbi:MAG: MFS transporter [Propionibacteriaceae bacterium]|nr:MFS transporter [Propionibacteriaceae bacterium]